MKASKSLIAAALVAGMLATPPLALAEDEHSGHHPEGQKAAEPAPQSKPAEPGTGKGGGMGDMGGGGMGMMADGMMGKMMQGGGMMRMMGTCPAQKTADALKTELGITDAPKGAWELVAAAQSKLQAGMPGMQKFAAKVMEAKSPLERLDAHIGILEERVTSLKDLKGAMSALYATFTDEQKKKADTALNGVGCMM